jgi:hypothetical protein
MTVKSYLDGFIPAGAKIDECSGCGVGSMLRTGNQAAIDRATVLLRHIKVDR